MTRAGGIRLGLLASLYTAQGLPYGFFTQALPVVLRENGVSLEAIGLSSLLAAPWALKFLWAPLMDRTGTLRGWILALQAVGVVAMAAMALLDPSAGLAPLVGAVLVTNLVAASQDVATDGLAVRILPETDRGLGNGVQVAAYRAGMIVGGGALLIVWERAGWAAATGGVAVLLAACSLPLLFAADVGAEAPSPSGGVAQSWDWVGLPGTKSWVGVLLAYKLGDYVGQGMLRSWLVDAGLGKDDIGWLLGLGGFGAGLLGAALGGWSTPKIGVRLAMVAFGALQVTGPLSYAAASAGWAPIAGAVLWEHLVGGMATTALFTAMMGACRPAKAGTDYTLQASVVVLGASAGAAVSGFVAGQLGYTGTFITAAALATLAPLVGAWVPAPSLSRS